MWYNEKNTKNYFNTHQYGEEKIKGVNLQTGESLIGNIWELFPVFGSTGLFKEEVTSLLIKEQLEIFNNNIKESLKNILLADGFYESVSGKSNYLYFYNCNTKKWCKLTISKCIVENVSLHIEFLNSLKKVEKSYISIIRLLNSKKHTIIRELVNKFNKIK